MNPPRPSSAWLARVLEFFEDYADTWKEAGSDIVAQRVTIAALTQDMTELFRLVGVPEAHMTPLQELNVALSDLRRGARHRLFEQHKGGRAPAGWLSDRRRIYAAALVRWLEPMPAGEAHSLIAKAFDRAGHKGYNGKKVTSSTVRKWCELVREGGDRSPEERVMREKLEEWREKSRFTAGPIEPSEFLRHIAEGLLKNALTP